MKAKRIENEVEVFDGYADVLCLNLENTGNGYIAHFPSNSSCRQDNYVCMDYAEAAYLYAALKKFKKDFK